MEEKSLKNLISYNNFDQELKKFTKKQKNSNQQLKTYLKIILHSLSLKKSQFFLLKAFFINVPIIIISFGLQNNNNNNDRFEDLTKDVRNLEG